MNSKRKVLLVSAVHPDLLPPIHNIALAYNDNQFQVDILSFGYSKSHNIEFRNENIFYLVKGLYSGSIFRKALLHFQFWRALSILRKQRREYYLIYVFCPVSFFWATLTFGSSKLIVHFIEIYVGPKPLGFDYLFLNFFLRNIYKARMIVTPSFERRDFMFKNFNIGKEPGVIFNAPFWSQDMFHRKDDSNGNARTKVIHTGGLNESRGIMELLHGFKLLNENDFELFITNVSNNPFSRRIISLIESENMHNVILMPTLSRSELMSLQASAEIGVCFIKRNGSLDTEYIAPNKLGEYLMNQMVCLVSDQQYFKSLEQETFLLSVNIYDPCEVAEMLIKAKTMVSKAGYREDILKFLSNEYNMAVQLKRNSLI